MRTKMFDWTWNCVFCRIFWKTMSYFLEKILFWFWSLILIWSFVRGGKAFQFWFECDCLFWWKKRKVWFEFDCDWDFDCLFGRKSNFDLSVIVFFWSYCDCVFGYLTRISIFHFCAWSWIFILRMLLVTSQKWRG